MSTWARGHSLSHEAQVLELLVGVLRGHGINPDSQCAPWLYTPSVICSQVIDYSALSHRLLSDLQASTHFCAESWCCAVFMIYIGFTHGWWWAATKMSVRALHRWSKKPSRPPPGSILLSDKSIAALPSASTHVAGSGSYSIRANPMFAGNDEEAAPGPRENQASSHGKASRL